MIEFTKAYKTSDGKTHSDVVTAQEHELKILLQWCPEDVSAGAVASVVGVIVANRATVIDILTTTATSKPRARSINGGRKKRKAVPEPAAA